MPARKTVLVIVAHADDMEFMAGGTIAQHGGPGLRDPRGDRHQQRARHAGAGLERCSSRRTPAGRRPRRGARALGVNPDIEFLGYEDGRLSETPLNELRERCMRAIRQHCGRTCCSPGTRSRPTKNHQDHRAVAWAATEAASFSHFPLYHPEHRARRAGAALRRRAVLLRQGAAGRQQGRRHLRLHRPQDRGALRPARWPDGADGRRTCRCTLAASGLEHAGRWRDADPKDYRPVIETQIQDLGGRPSARRARLRRSRRSSGGSGSAG